MGNREKILAVLHNEGPLCDGCLKKRAHIKNPATVNQITRALADDGIIIRRQGVCPGDGKVKYINKLVDSSRSVDEGTDNQDTNSNFNHPPRDYVKEKWYWEGNVQSKIVEYLKNRGFRILREANTGSKEAGVDIVAISPDMKRLLVSVKGFPFEDNKNKNTQARHWFAEAIFDIVLYRQEYPEVLLAIGLPLGFTTYQNLIQKVTWFKESVPFNYIWVSNNGQVHEE